MVYLETVNADRGNEDIENMLEADEARLKRYIRRHFELTGSRIAETVLERWNEYRSRFVRVMPFEYQSALESIRNAGIQTEEYRQVQHG